MGLCLCLSGCSRPQTEAKPETGPQVVATIFPLYDFARQILGDDSRVTLLLSPGMESHSYDPSPQDMIRVLESDLFLYIGGESDAWVERTLEGGERPAGTALRLMDVVEALEEEEVPGAEGRGHSHSQGDEADHDHDHDHDHEEGGHDEHSVYGELEYDEHIWTSPPNAIRMVEAIADALCELDPAGAAAYRENAAAYEEQLAALDEDFRAVTENGARHELVFGDRFPFRYLVEEYGLAYAAAFPGCSGESEPSAATVAALVDHIKNNHIPVVFYLELSNHRVADVLAESTGAQTRELHSLQTVTREEFEAGETYLSLMERNLEHIKEALN